MKSPVNRLAQIALVVAVTLLPACESEVQSPDLGFLYNERAKAESPDRSPVLLIPGILGSRLIRKEHGSSVWGAWGSGPPQPSNDEALRLLALPMALDQPLAELGDEVNAVGALDRVKISLFGLSVELKAYHRILRTLGVGGYRDEELGEANAIDYGKRHYTCFQFAYDWRRDLVESARALHAFVLDKRAYVAREHERRFGVREVPVRFDIVAHSMGGLVLRYYLRYGTQDLPADGSLPQETWAGTEFINNVILIGTPNAGSIDSFEHLVDGAITGQSYTYSYHANTHRLHTLTPSAPPRTYDGAGNTLESTYAWTTSLVPLAASFLIGKRSDGSGLSRRAYLGLALTFKKGRPACRKMVDRHQVKCWTGLA